MSSRASPTSFWAVGGFRKHECARATPRRRPALPVHAGPWLTGTRNAGQALGPQVGGVGEGALR
ncbi:hypothetical protein, partial [Streptomyces sp. NPDC005046]